MTEDERARPQDASSTDELERLLELLVGRERREIEVLRKKLEDYELDAEALGDVLPAATQRAAKDRRFAAALAPTVEDAIERSVKSNPKPLTDAIFPLMGPAIRKAISNALSGMAESFNQALENSLSWQGLKWRMEARRTGLPFSEIVLLHNLVYRVEQVFLIHRESGVALAHVSAEAVDEQDPDMVSGMLSAIQEFVSDSFGSDEAPGEGELRQVEVGGTTVEIAQGPDAVLAAVVRGESSHKYRNRLQRAVEQFHLEYAEELVDFEGDTEPFKLSQPLLETCMEEQLKDTDDVGGGRGWAAPVALAVVALLIGAWFVRSARDQRRIESALELLRNEPGIVVVESERDGARLSVSGMRDPLARDPREVIASTGLRDVDWGLEPFRSHDPQLVMRHARTALEPDSFAHLALEEGGVLRATGRATHRWIQRAHEVAATLPGVTRFDAAEVIDIDRTEFEALRGDLAEKIAGRSSEDWDADTSRALERAIRSLDAVAARAGWLNIVEVRGIDGLIVDGVDLELRLASIGTEATVLDIRRGVAASGARVAVRTLPSFDAR